ncbi:uncharacterized protein MYCFIDRAFT_206533 [Pseudocercospora fijiensis CIRAD86]|uniref:Uncharacterized protein n=1 Tax=Pseudocercospora fijiensis (strain CIRAD86) TaxID=383855 RepID=M3ALP1_PSEFD|nr:uncharacterized protein MYCFIDRAFT_206533 [Pseudocercospora fijiensis CIRAD86]EME85511.1 hypothetical protein MYCFIDRAFT_206533 [Pseudocercospora fijiensis CIRAD86]
MASVLPSSSAQSAYKPLNNDPDHPSNMNPWQPGFFRRIPWAGISCLFAVLCCCVVEITILVASNGAHISSWKYAPSVYLSVAYTLSNILLSAAFTQGLTIHWWRKALTEGTQLGDLHRYWDHGTSAVAAAFAGRHFSYISFAAIFVALTPINGPLLQRASTTTTDTRYYHSDAHDVQLKIPVVKTLQDPTGYTSGRAYTVTMLDTKFAPVVQAWSTGQSIVVNETGCAGDGKCSGLMTGAGLAISCNSSTADFDLSGTNENGSINNASFTGTDIFQVIFGWSALTPSNITLDMQYKPGKACSKGQLQVKNCTIGAATVQYPIEIDGNKSTISLATGSTLAGDHVVSLVDYDLENMYGLPSPLGGYAYALSSKLNSATRVRFAGAAGYEVTSGGSTAAQFANMDDVTDYTMGLCYTKFSDPTDYLLQQARNLMFRTAFAQANATTMQNVTSATETRTVTVYKTHYAFLGSAVGVTLVAIGVVLATFNGFWLLGRSVTLSPIETAKAFNAPLLAQEPANAEVKELVKGAGMKPVRYGQPMTIRRSPRILD